MSNIVKTSKEVIPYIQKNTSYKSYYAIAKKLSEHSDTVNVQPTQVRNYYIGKHRVSEKVGMLFFEAFNIVIIDITKGKGRPSVWQ